MLYLNNVFTILYPLDLEIASWSWYDNGMFCGSGNRPWSNDKLTIFVETGQTMYDNCLISHVGTGSRAHCSLLNTRCIMLMMMMMNWITFIAPYCENYTSRAIYKDFTNDIPNKYAFNCRLNESSIGISLMLSGRLFQAVGAATKKVRSPNLVQDDCLGTASLTPDVDTDHSIDRLSLMTSSKQRSAMQPGAIP